MVHQTSSFSIVAEHEGRKKEQFDGMDRVAYSRAPHIRCIKAILVFLKNKAKKVCKTTGF